MALRSLVAAACVGLLLVSCDAPTGHEVVGGVTLLRQAHPADTYPAGVGIGTLVVQNGCVGIEGPDGVAYVVWMPATELREGSSGMEVVVGDESAQIGESIQIGGGYGDLAWVEGLTADGIPEGCRDSGAQAYFLHGGGLAHVTP